MSNPKARLTGLFQDASASSQGNDVLRYVAPKEPSRQQQQQQQQQQSQVQAQTNATPAAAIVYTTMVSLYQYDATARKYVQMGTTGAGGSVTVGCVIVGNNANYNLLFYNAAKAHLCLVPIKFGSFKPILQPKNYVNFYDDKGINWSVKFASQDQVSEFMKQIFLTKIHTEIWGTEKTVTKTSPNVLIQDDLVHIKEDAHVVTNGDTVAVTFSCWRVVGSASCAPNEVVKKYAPFEQATDADLRKFRLGDGNERIKALEEGVVGMKKGGKRMILAPPGKTNGKDWYLIEVQLVKTKAGGSNSQRKSLPQPSAPISAENGATSGASTSKTPRRKSSPTNTSDAEASNSNETERHIVPYANETTLDELELKELSILQLKKQLEIQAKAVELAQLNASAGGHSGQFNPANPFGQQQQPPFGQSGYGFSTSYNGSLFNPPQSNPMVTASGRPLDGLIMELHAKIDYLIRMAPTSNSSSVGGSSIGGVTDVSAVIRGVERLAGENERLLLQINSQNQQYSSYEKRCEELLKQNQRLQEEKRALDEKYQSAASLQLNYNSEITALTSARDAAITQTNRLHAEYQQLLTAFYQKQQVSSEAEEQRNELNFERESRVRLEKELKKETQTRSLIEQELQLTKKQYDVFMKLKDSELLNQKQELEKQWTVIQAQDQKKNEERLRKLTLEYQNQNTRQQEEHQAQLEHKDKQMQFQLESLQQQIIQLTNEKQELADRIEMSNSRVQELEEALQNASAGQAGMNNAELNLATEEKRIYQEQIELLQQQVKELEAEKFERVQQDLVSPRLIRSTSFAENAPAQCDSCAALEEQKTALEAREAAAARTLAMVEEIKREAETMLQDKPAFASNGEADRDKLINLFKEAVNEMFFRFQDYFEEQATLESKQVLTVIRKVLKQSTKDVVQRLQEPASAVDGDDSDGPPIPPPQVQEEAAALAAAVAAQEAIEQPKNEDEQKPSTEAQEASTTEQPHNLMNQTYPSSDEDENDDFVD